MKRKKNVTRFGYLDGWQRKGGSNCLKTEEEPHKLRSLCITFVFCKVEGHAEAGNENICKLFGSLPDFPSLCP
jgi:hypothetical protein